MSYTPDDAAMDEWIDEMREEFREDLAPEIIGDFTYGKLQSYFKARPEVHKKVETLIALASNLYRDKYFGSSLVVSQTAVECTFRDLIFHPLVSGAFTEDSIGATLMNYFLKDGIRSVGKIAIQILNRFADIDLCAIQREGSKARLSKEIQELRSARNQFVHEGIDPDPIKSETSIEVAQYVYEEVFLRVLKSLGLSLSPSGRII